MNEPEAGAAAPANRTAWRVAHAALFVVFLATAALNMARIRAGFLTSHAADLVVPAWLYISTRRLATGGRSANPVLRWLARSPERTAISLFAASALTELSQIVWPEGLFRGVFDPLDLVAYAAGLVVCYAADKRLGPLHRRGEDAEPASS